MSHQTGIKANEELKSFFGHCKDGKVRVIKISIQNEQLVLTDFKAPKGTWEDDYDRYMLNFIEDKQPCYIFYCLDSQNNLGYEWVFISWSPDDSPSRVDIAIDSRHQTLQGIVFPISDDAIAALFDMKNGILNYVQLSIDIDKEEINLESCDDTNINSLPSRVPRDHARYHLFCFPHSYEGDYLLSKVFIYSTPGYECSVKERMLYSSCKSPLLDVIENKIGIEIAKKIETDDRSELTAQFLLEEIHPKKNIHRQKFAKPKGPGHRGPRRLIRTPRTEAEEESGAPAQN
ncbi:twinfilin-1-like isoform X4 [Centruroides sculpturatus]|uniref:twinfilin-1-like isoform X4 n=1 Tax=Centruroides sculpturatus TaxID=218467 RepID=UPI000C6D541A|nr:twinfilin-1-like isoform X4 [Centruroides sculpturatus]